MAADAVVGDHGSVTLYGAALGKPVLLASFGSDAVPGTAADSLGRAAPRLDPLGDMVRQIRTAVGEHTPSATERSVSRPSPGRGRHSPSCEPRSTT